MEFAKKLGVVFVQILEPRAVGRYTGRNVALSSEQISLLEKMYLDFNSSKKLKSYPIMNYLGYHQRKVGCFGAGNRFFYIDAGGDAHLCPFCQGKMGNVLHNTAEDIIRLLEKSKCHVYNSHVQFT